MATDALATARPSRPMPGSATRSCCSSRSAIATARRRRPAHPARPVVGARHRGLVDGRGARRRSALRLRRPRVGARSAPRRPAMSGIVELLVEAERQVRDVCDCAGAESPLVGRHGAGDRDVVDYLLDAGADPNAPAFAGATPLHVAMQRGHHELVPACSPRAPIPTRRRPRPHAGRLARACTRPTRTPNGRRRGDRGPTGIRAVDLFAPLRRGCVQHWPPAVGLGQTVLLFAIADALRPAQFWLLGFEHGPVQPGRRRATKRGRPASMLTSRLAPAGGRRARARARFGTRADRVPGHSPAASSSRASRARAMRTTSCSPCRRSPRDPDVLSTIVIEPFDGHYPRVTAEPPEGFDAQVAFDVRRAKRRPVARRRPEPHDEPLVSE